MIKNEHQSRVKRGARLNRHEYVDSLLPTDPILQQVEQSIRDSSLPAMSVRPALGRLLTILIESSRVRQALEIGTYAGYSAICMARGLPSDGLLTSLEVRPEHASLARHNLSIAGLLEKVRIIEGTATDSLDVLTHEQARFDLVFIDADKPNYPAYLNKALELLRPGGLIVADNVLLQDRVIDMNDENPSPKAVRAFNHHFMTHPSLIGAVLPLYDGFAIGLVRRPL